MTNIITSAGKATEERTKAQETLSNMVENAQNDNQQF